MSKVKLEVDFSVSDWRSLTRDPSSRPLSSLFKFHPLAIQSMTMTEMYLKISQEGMVKLRSTNSLFAQSSTLYNSELLALPR